MADAVVIPQVQPVQPVLRFLRIIPGVLLLAAIGYAGKLLEKTSANMRKPIIGSFRILSTFSGPSCWGF